MRDPRLPPTYVAIFATLLGVIGGSVAGMLAFVAEDTSALLVTVGFAVALLGASVGLWKEWVWGGPLFSFTLAVASLLAIPTGSVGEVAGAIGLVFALVVSWGFVRAGFRKVRDLPPVEPEKAGIERGSPFVSHVYYELWIVIAIVAVIGAIVVPMLLKK